MTQENPADFESQTVHCLVHPGFDFYDQPEFESYVHAYIEEVAKRAHDVLLIVSHGERFSIEQIQQFVLLDIINTISFFIAQTFNTPDMKYHPSYVNFGLSEVFFQWCMENIDFSELVDIEREQLELRENFLEQVGKREISLFDADHKEKSDALNMQRDRFMREMDIEGYAYKALGEIGKINDIKFTNRKVRNSGRFFRIFQHATEALGSERVREIFIHDGEDAEALPILPVIQYIGRNGEKIPTYAASMSGDSWGCEYHASEYQQNGNAAELRDRIITDLSVSRNSSLAAQQPKEVLADIGVEVTSDTKFVFLGEYRKRCVDNVFHIMNYRMSPVTGDNWFIAHDAFTLERAEKHISFDWI